MDPVPMLLGLLGLAGIAASALLTWPYALRVWIGPVLLVGVLRWANPPDPPGPYDALGLVYLATFAAAWSAPFLFRAVVEAAREINRCTTKVGEARSPLSDQGLIWLRRLDLAILALVAVAVLTAL